MARREVLHAGLDALAMATTLLQRVDIARPFAGQYQAADLHWWWTVPRSTDELDQLFFVDDGGRPVAAVIATDWGDGSSSVYETTTLAVVTMPDAPADWRAHVLERGLDHAAAAGIAAVELEVDRADDVVRDWLRRRGFTLAGDGLIECGIDLADRPAVSPLAHGYHLVSRRETADRPHHLAGRRGPTFEARLRTSSLYRPDLDLVVVDGAGEPAAYGLCWYDPTTATGLVEPMRTHDAHQRLGLARHVLTAGLERLAAAGARRAAICYEPDNPASGPLYRNVGFRPHRRNDVLAGPTSRPASGADRRQPGG